MMINYVTLSHDDLVRWIWRYKLGRIRKKRFIHVRSIFSYGKIYLGGYLEGVSG
jgi:hypothetical protein